MQRTLTRLKFFRICVTRSSAVVVLTFLFVYFLPKPYWLCEHWEHKGSSAQVDTPFPLSWLKLNVVDPDKDAVGRMFPIYNRDYKEKNFVNFKGGNSASSSTANVNVFRLQNENFTNFGRSWVNTPAGSSLSSVSIEKLRRLHKLPDCVQLKVPPEAAPTKICVHFPADDNFISNRLRDSGEWEMDLVFQLDTFFTTNPKSQLVDLGCNIGVFSLFAASLGKHSLALDILPSNLALLHLSIMTNDEQLSSSGLAESDLDLGDARDALKPAPEPHRTLGRRSRFSQLITTVNNAVYSRRQKMQIYLKPWDFNLGGTEVKEVHAADVNITDPRILVDAICLDDLLIHVKANLSVFLKIDVEGSEPDVFLCASNFFMYVDVRVILMEILFHRYSKQGKTMARFLLTRNMLPSEDVNGRKLLDPDPDKMYNWPENMFWVKVR